jgi:hypothetical protein
MLLGCWFVKLDLQYYHIMVCRNTELQYSVIQLLRKYHRPLLELGNVIVVVLLLCTFSVIQWVIVLFSCTFSVIQWVIVLFLCTFSISQWVIVLFFIYMFSHSVSHRPVFYVHLQSCSESSSCFEEFHDDLLAFIIIIVWYIFRTSGIQCPVWRCHWRSSWCNNYCNDHFRDPILHEKER